MRAEEYNYLFWKVTPYGARINQVLLWIKQDAFLNQPTTKYLNLMADLF